MISYTPNPLHSNGCAGYVGEIEVTPSYLRCRCGRREVLAVFVSGFPLFLVIMMMSATVAGAPYCNLDGRIVATSIPSHPLPQCVVRYMTLRSRGSTDTVYTSSAYSEALVECSAGGPGRVCAVAVEMLVAVRGTGGTGGISGRGASIACGSRGGGVSEGVRSWLDELKLTLSTSADRWTASGKL